MLFIEKEKCLGEMIYDTTPLLRYLVLEVFITSHKDHLFFPSHLLYSTLQSFSLDTLLFLQLFPICFSSRVLFFSIFSNFSPFYSNIPYHISCHPIHITFLLWIFQGKFLSNIHSFLRSFPAFLSSFLPFHTLFQILLPILLHFSSFLSLPMYHFLL